LIATGISAHLIYITGIDYKVTTAFMKLYIDLENTLISLIVYICTNWKCFKGWRRCEKIITFYFTRHPLVRKLPYFDSAVADGQVTADDKFPSPGIDESPDPFSPAPDSSGIDHKNNKRQKHRPKEMSFDKVW